MGKFDTYIESWRAKLARERFEHQKRTEQMRELAVKYAKVLADKYGVKRVYLFGSLIRDGFTHPQSDIDLAVEGLASAAYFSVLNDFYDLAPSGIEVDLVPMEDAYDELRERIIKEGELLYERK